MSGHSKWSKVKHQKASTDAVKSQAFTKASRAITVAVREGGGITDSDKNFHLRLAIEKAKEVNMPKDTIERAIERGAAAGGASFEQILYEGYGPGGSAILVSAATDNRQRTAANIKHLFDRAGGTLTAPGAVSFQFKQSGVLIIPKLEHTFDQVLEAAVSAGADDVIERTDVYEVYASRGNLMAVKERLTGAAFPVENTELIMRPNNVIVPPDDVREKVGGLVDALEALDDVQQVFTNIE